jgi:hypothetical protein
MENLQPPAPQYPVWFADWKKRIQTAQIKAALHVNRDLLLLYWELGRDIVAKQKTSAWGEGLIPRFAKDLKAAFPHLTGFSPRNLFYVRRLYLFYQEEFPIVQQVAAQLDVFDSEQFAFFVLVPWGHHQVVLDKCKGTTEAIFYLKKTIQNNWSRNTLRDQMKQNLYERQGKAMTNFELWGF